jgi:hypothetical protein
MGNNNKAKHDGREGNVRRERTKIIPSGSGSIRPAGNHTAKQKKSKRLATKALRDVFGSEAELFKHIAQEAQNGCFKHLQMAMEYAYGKSGAAHEEKGPPQIVKPTINFIGNGRPTEKTEDTDYEDITGK